MAMILEPFISKFVEQLFDFAQENVVLGVSGEIEDLESKLHVISKVLADAERRRINDRAIDYWLKELKDFMYDADDILDLCRIEADKCSEGSSSTSSARFPFSLFSWFRKPHIGGKIRELNRKLEKISKRRSEFKLEDTYPDKQKVTSQISRKSSPLVEMDLVGSTIEEDTQRLVDVLINADKRKNFLVYAIVGAGGIGKTTLAQKIYADQRIHEEFTEKRWVCVSQEFDEVNLLKDIIGDAKDDLAGHQSRPLLEPIAESIFAGKKLFLVLDDVWTAEVWNDLLRNTLNNCAAGSRILVTTRNTQIARQMLAVYAHPVRVLSLEDGWSLLCKKVYLTGEEGGIPHLKSIGMEIVKKCDGLPLAIKAIAGVLCKKEKTERAWHGVLESTAWSTSGLPEAVKGALYLSYEDLPSYLKQCFLYCSLFPEDHRINKHTIPRLWIAEGFLKAEGGLTIEDAGEECYRELIMRNLLQPNFGNQSTCQMHQLLHCLARHLARDESSIVRKVQEVGSRIGQMKLRRVCVTDKETKEIPDVLVKQRSLRTLMWQTCPLSETQMNVLFIKFSCLRVLDISSSEIQSLPDSFANLTHLRYLNISHTKIRVIPENIRNLRNLQFLEIVQCRFLSQLPNSIVTLHNLRSLDLYDTEVVGMPQGLGRLQNLHLLHGFKLPRNQAEGWCMLKELISLSFLRSLSIQRLDHTSSSLDASGAELRNKTKLRALRLHCTDEPQPTKEGMTRIKEVFEELHPPPCLEELKIMGYFGRELPEWMKMAETSLPTSILFPNLRQLELHGCKYSDQLPPCGLLPSLDVLCIRDAGSVLKVGPEFLVGTSSSSSGGGRAGVDSSKYAFPMLETLQFQNMPNWQTWHWDEGRQAMPCLKYLRLWKCPKLVSLPEGLLLQATSLTKLKISGADSLSTIEKLHSLKELYIKKNPNLEKVSDLPVLTTLEVVNCPKLQVVANLQSLKRMKLDDDGMKTLPSYILKGANRRPKKRKVEPTVQLEKLNIRCSMELITNISKQASREWLTIQGIQQVNVYSPDRLKYVFYTKLPPFFTTNIDDPTTSRCSRMSSSSSGVSF